MDVPMDLDVPFFGGNEPPPDAGLPFGEDDAVEQCAAGLARGPRVAAHLLGHQIGCCKRKPCGRHERPCWLLQACGGVNA